MRLNLPLQEKKEVYGREALISIGMYLILYMLFGFFSTFIHLKTILNKDFDVVFSIYVSIISILVISYIVYSIWKDKIRVVILVIFTLILISNSAKESKTLFTSGIISLMVIISFVFIELIALFITEIVKIQKYCAKCGLHLGGSTFADIIVPFNRRICENCRQEEIEHEILMKQEEEIAYRRGKAEEMGRIDARQEYSDSDYEVNDLLSIYQSLDRKKRKIY